MLKQRLFKTSFVLFFTYLSYNIAFSQGTQSVWCWGYNTYGQLGLGNTATQNSPKLVIDSNEFTNITSGNSHIIAIKKNGTLWAWGNNWYGQLGLGNSTNYYTPQQVGTDSNWLSVSSGSLYTVAIKKDGTLWAWGYNYYGQLGLGNETTYNLPQKVGADTTWCIVATGEQHTVAIKKDGTLWAWGYNSVGQLGLGNTNNYNTPQQIGIDTNWKSVIAGQGHTFGTKNNGSIWCWGWNHYGQLGLGNKTNFDNPQFFGTDSNWLTIKAGYMNSIGMKKDRTLWAWGNNVFGQLGLGNNTDYNSPQQIGTDTSWESISAGAHHVVAIKQNNTLWSWGNNGYGQLGLGNFINYNSPQRVFGKNWRKIYAGGFYTFSVNMYGGDLCGKNSKVSKHLTFSDDTLLLCNSGLQLKKPNQLYSFYRWKTGHIADSFTLNVADFSTDEFTWVYMDNDSFCSIDSIFIKVVPNSLRIDQKRFEISFTNNTKDTILDLYEIFNIPKSSGFNFYNIQNKLKTDSIIVKSGNNYSQIQSYFIGIDTFKLICNPIKLKIVKGVKKIWDDDLDNGKQSLWTWGYNVNGQLGLGNKTNKSIPQIILRSTEIKHFALGYKNSFVIKKDGTLWSWGEDQLGFENTNSLNFPQQVGFDTIWESISAGYLHVVAIKKDGTLWAWGYNWYGQLGLGNTNYYNIPQQIGSDSNWSKVCAGVYSNFTIAIKKDGTLWSWGANEYGQLGLGNTIKYLTPQKVGSDSNWSKVSAGQVHVLALKKDGTLWAWGGNYWGQAGLGKNSSYQYNTPQQVGTDTIWSMIAAHYGHSVALKKNGTLWSWGGNNAYELGQGNRTNYFYPKQIGKDSQWSYTTSNFAIKKDGTLWAWGGNYVGQLGFKNGNFISTPKMVNNEKNWETVYSGMGHTIAVKNSPDCIVKDIISISNSDSIVACSNLKIVSNNIKSISHQWNNGDTTLTTIIKNSGLVTLKETDSRNCLIFDSVYVRLLKDEISQAPDTSICNVQANDTFKLNLNNWFGTSDYYFYNKSKSQINTADVFVKNSASKKWTGFVALKTNTSLKCPVSGNIHPSVVYPRLLSKTTDTLLTSKTALKPAIVDKKYTTHPNYLWSNGDTTWTTNYNNSGSY